MTRVNELLRNLDLGNSVAEFDADLENYFIETNTFRELINDKIDIVAGDKGTGKTAIYQILQKKFATLPTLTNTEVIAAFNPTGNPVFQKLGEHGVLDEGEYIRMWKLYVLSLTGNWLLGIWEGNFTKSMASLDELLRGLDVRGKDETPQNLFVKILAKVGKFFNWKAADVELSMTETGLPVVKPHIEFDTAPTAPQSTPSVAMVPALRLLDKCLSEAGVTAWIAIDRLDEAFQGFPDIEVPALRALLRTYLDLSEFPRIRLKLFLRRDLFRRIIAGGFVNLTHVNARKIEVIWDEEDLLNLLCRRIRRNREFAEALDVEEANDSTVFHRTFPPQVDVGKRKPQTWTWIMRRIRDGNDIKPPRNLIDLISMAKQAQLRREDRDSRDYHQGTPVIEGDSLRRALRQLSAQRVQDTLLAEAAIHADLINKFRDGKAEHNIESLAALLAIDSGAVRSRIEPLLNIGFLEGIKGTIETFKVPSLYRDGLNMTQGKAFDATAPSLEEDEDE